MILAKASYQIGTNDNNYRERQSPHRALLEAVLGQVIDRNTSNRQ